MSSVIDVIRGIINTEKACRLSKNGSTYIFKVSVNADKRSIKTAIESVFTVSVVSVNVMIVKSCSVRFRGRLGKKSGYKKAVVKLAHGQKIDVGNMLS